MSRMRLLVTITAFLSLTQLVQAQLLDSDTTRWAWNLSSSFYLSSGNVDRLLLRNQLGVKHLSDQGWGFASDNRYIYGTFSGFQTENDWWSLNLFYWQPERKVYLYGMVWLETNFRRKLDFRYQLGPGITYRLFRSGHSSIKLSLTGTLEHNRFAHADLENYPPRNTRTLELFRITSRIYGNHSFANNNLILIYEAWYQQGLDRGANYRMHTDLAIVLPLFRNFGIRSNLNYAYENVVVQGIRKGDLIWTIGVTLNQQYL